MKFLKLLKQILQEDSIKYSEENLKSLRDKILAKKEEIKGIWGHVIKNKGENLSLKDVEEIIRQMQDNFDDAKKVFPEDIVDDAESMSGSGKNPNVLQEKQQESVKRKKSE